MATIDPIFVWCHLCHASCGQPCRFGLRPGEQYHGRRIHLAATIAKLRKDHPDTWVTEGLLSGGSYRDIEHAIDRGSLCVDDGWGCCRTCGQNIERLQRLRSIPQET